MSKKYEFSEDEFIHLLKGAVELAFGYSKLQGKTETDCANFVIGAVLASIENKQVRNKNIIQRFYDTAGFLYAVRFWRLVIYVDNKEKSLRYGGIVTNIGLARFMFWRFSFVG